MTELAEIFDWVRTQALPRLITGMEPSEPALPTRYDITLGYEDERSAISAGSTTPATELHARRLSAAVARIDLVDLIGSSDGAPSEAQITAWLSNLADDEVLARASQLQPSHTHHPDIVQFNLGVIEGMRDEALSFVHNRQPDQI